MPWYTLEYLLRSLDCTLQFTVGGGVLLVKFKIAFIRKETVPSLRTYVLDVIGGDYSC